MENHEHIELTASEISALWTAYQSSTMSVCGLKYILNHVEDEQIRVILENTFKLIQQQVEQLTNFFHQENYPVPLGFTEQDVNVDAPRLFSDKLYLEAILNMTDMSLVSFTAALVAAEREDVINFFSENLIKFQNLHKQSKKLSKEKGIYIRAPHIPKYNQVDFVKKQKFLAGWFADRRPLLGAEITNLVFNTKRNALGQAIITGFSQVAKSKEVRRYFERGREIAGKHLEVFTSILHEDYLSDGALLMTSEVMDSTVAPFSDKLMMELTATLIASGIGQYGVSMAASPRRDLGTHYARLTTEVAAYSEDGANILIDNGWMEQPPMAADRKELAK
ncbi:DUF3231 family protein [Virgibacillus ainsalahensis]